MADDGVKAILPTRLAFEKRIKGKNKRLISHMARNFSCSRIN